MSNRLAQHNCYKIRALDLKLLWHLLFKESIMFVKNSFVILKAIIRLDLTELQNIVFPLILLTVLVGLGAHLIYLFSLHFSPTLLPFVAMYSTLLRFLSSQQPCEVA